MQMHRNQSKLRFPYGEIPREENFPKQSKHLPHSLEYEVESAVTGGNRLDWSPAHCCVKGVPPCSGVTCGLHCIYSVLHYSMQVARDKGQMRWLHPDRSVLCSLESQLCLRPTLWNSLLLLFFQLFKHMMPL